MATGADGNPINYAKLFEINSIAGAVVFAVLYLPLFLWFILQSFRNATRVHFVITFFTAIRVTAFTIRAILAGVTTAGQNLNLLIGYEVLFNIGFFGLLYSAYNLVLDREILSERAPPNNPILRLTRNRMLFRAVMTVAVVLGISGISLSQSTSASSAATGTSLRKTSLIIFLVLTVLQAFQTLVLAKSEFIRYGSQDTRVEEGSLGKKHGIYVLLCISVLLLIREAFSVATISNLSRQYEEKLWYPLIALPEILAVVLYATPGLVPPRGATNQYSFEGNDKEANHGLNDVQTNHKLVG